MTELTVEFVTHGLEKFLLVLGRGANHGQQLEAVLNGESVKVVVEVAEDLPRRA